MNKKTLMLLMLFLLILIGLTWYYQSAYRYAQINWPRSSLVDKGKDQDITITLKESFITEHGNWPKHTVFQIFEDKIHEIETNDAFSFYGFKFKHGALIVSTPKHDAHYYQLFLKDKLTIDGLDLHEQCTLEFKNRVLYAATCPEFETVKFKRFITPESLNFKADGEEIPVP